MSDKTFTHWLDTLENSTDDHARIKAIQILYNFKNEDGITIAKHILPFINNQNEHLAQTAIRAVPAFINYQRTQDWHTTIVPPALEQYKAVLKGQHSEERQLIAVEHIAKLSTPNNTPHENEGNLLIITVLLDMIVHPNSTVRANAINRLYGLKRYGDPIVPRLSTALYDADPLVRQAALDLIPYLSSSSVQPKELLAPLHEKVLDLFESEVTRELRVLALRAYQRIVGNEHLKRKGGDYVRDVALEGLLPLNLPPSIVNTLQLTCCDILRQFPEQIVVDKLQAFISSPHAISRASERATNVLQRMSAAKPSLVQRLGAATPNERVRILQSMKGSLPKGDEVDALLPYLNDANPTARQAAATALASSRESYRISQPLIDAVLSGRVTLSAISNPLANQGDRMIMSTIVNQAQNAPEHIRIVIERDWRSINEYIDRMSRLY